MTRGDCTSAGVVCELPPLYEALVVDLMAILPPEIRLSAVDHEGAACGHLEKMVPGYTGEILRRPTVGKPLL